MNSKISKMVFDKAGEEEHLSIGDRWVGHTITSFCVFEYNTFAVVQVWDDKENQLVMEIPMHKVCRILYKSTTVSNGDE